MNSVSCALGAVSALWSISSQISDENADAFCKSLEKESLDLLETLKNLYDKHKERNTFDDRSFCRYVVDLIYLQTKNSLSNRLSAGLLKEVCDERCKCCESWNDGVRSRAFSKADIQIKKMLEDPSGNFELFHEFAKLAVQNEVERQEIRMSQSLRVAAALPVAASVVFPVPAATTFPVAAVAFPPSKDDEDCAMYD
jgi:hypothetical protein